MQQTVKHQLSVRLAVFIAAVSAVFLLIGGPADAEGPPPPAVEYVVTAGDTLWASTAALPKVVVRSDAAVDARRATIGLRPMSVSNLSWRFESETDVSRRFRLPSSPRECQLPWPIGQFPAPMFNIWWQRWSRRCEPGAPR